ncbi:chemotaxis response regulator protein-glutamate methylesterase [Paenibacillus sp. CF384]|uniref:protein-glutamate methylesterase/protein-glutamine glutaminase n=1 Tax=Paenibacillus sp. CF384 TaxID=1884382 RepID=UPI00089BAF77|nr:chemotaxis response regulator protein-glutamate methylesterase [Paenibacillus sp. CF384]SDW27188.1 two-component system, chemotaxis family, response regulator CheB [Paenibacillus sp. CF384]
MNTISRVLVVDDSAFMRKILCDLIALDPQFDIIATANNGREAIDAVRTLKPDVITMDLEMPEMNGLEALERIMRIHPVPIIMLSSISDDGTRETIKALQNGAFDFIRKPSGPMSPDIHTVGEQLLEKLRIAVLTNRQSYLFQPSKPVPSTKKPSMAKAKSTTISFETAPSVKDELQLKPIQPLEELTSLRERKPAAAQEKLEKPAPTIEVNKRPTKKELEPTSPPMDQELETAIKPNKLVRSKSFKHLVAIGTSTGGPRALHEVISTLPIDFPAPVLVVQHMPPKFTRSLAQRLDTFSSLHVTEAIHGERVEAGVVYIAPGGYHMELTKEGGSYSIKLSEEAPRGGHRPSVDTMFESCAAFPELRRHSVIMTGMGSDGVKGMKALNDSGAETAIAESEETCVVYGMPRSAVEAGVAKSIVPLRQIATAITHAVRK